MEEIKETMTQLFARRITQQASSSTSSETIEKAISMYQEQFAQTKSKYGYSHEMTLSHLKELSMLYSRQQKTDIAVKELTTAIAEITTKEQSTQKLLESASYIAQSFQACQQEKRCLEIIQELHRQIIAKDTKQSSKFGFNLTQCSSASLMFIASLEYHMRTDLSLTFSEILSDIIAESVYYENFRRVMKANEDLEAIVLAAAPLRHFLYRRNRRELATILEDQITNLFKQRDVPDHKFLSKDSPRIFIVGILDQLGNRKTVNFVRLVIIGTNKVLFRLVDQNKFKEAYDIANIAFMYAQYHKGYHGPRAISRGFELAAYLDGRGENRCPDPGLRQQLLKLSNSIIKEILKICKEQKINFAQVQLPEVNQLIALLGEQKDYETLETLLTDLWNTRDAQRSWPPQVLLNLGRRLICARYLANHPIKALRLCEDIAYNMRRVHGARHPATLETYDLLAQLYTSTGLQYAKGADKDKNAAGLASEYFKKAVLVREDLLRLVVSEQLGSEDDDDEDEDTAAAILAEHGVSVSGSANGDDGRDQIDAPAMDKAQFARTQLRMLKLAFQRLGNWPRQYAVYERLNADVFRAFELQGVEGVEKWTAKGFGGGKAESQEGEFSTVKNWEILGPELRREMEEEEEL
ncbi:hypothetical protein LTS18_013809 [Coniosporium uncinatum]|uniref:Uncharacterized protein n=1 Tax=Coniosporium uncinatum TaxID=93489 RepID=A0ACC3DV83_9PEZI|nr:hypothetical protein LTS18_013809 [Coniosporium uncinatum]